MGAGVLSTWWMPRSDRWESNPVRGRRGKREGRGDPLNVPLEDAELLAEVELTTNLIIAANESDAPLAPEIDQLLGVIPAQRGAEASRPLNWPRLAVARPPPSMFPF